MTERTHTPGPWKIGPHYPQDQDQAYDVLPWLGQSHRICSVRPSNEAYANARLIAAAPALYAALNQLTDWFRPDTPGNELIAHLDRARAALAAATVPA